MNVLLGWCAWPLTLSSLGPRSFHLVCTLFPAFCDTESDLYYRVGLSLKLISGAGRLKLKLISGGGAGRLKLKVISGACRLKLKVICDGGLKKGVCRLTSQTAHRQPRFLYYASLIPSLSPLKPLVMGMRLNFFVSVLFSLSLVSWL